MTVSTPPASTNRHLGRQVAFVACYFVIYLGYLFIHQEGELLHWLGLVLLPLAAVGIIGAYPSVRRLLQSIGLDPRNATRGLGLVAVLAVAFLGLQLLNGRQRADLLSGLNRPLGFVAPIIAVVLLLGTAATTEEVFFRGLLQSRLADALHSHLAALLLTTVAFVFYHLPYAYLNPSWPSAGDLSAALELAAANGFLGGIALGAVYWRTKRNLFATIFLHASINLVPATLLVLRLIRPSP